MHYFCKGKKLVRKLNFMILVLWLISFSSKSLAQPNPIQVEVVPTEVGIGQTFQIIVRLSGSTVEEPVILSPDGVSISNYPDYSGMSTEIRMTFGQAKIVTTKERHYRGVGNQEGKWEIKVRTKIDNKEYESLPVYVTVTSSPSTQPQSGSTVPVPTPQPPGSPRSRHTPGRMRTPQTEDSVLDNVLFVESEIPKRIVFQGEILNVIYRAKILETPEFVIQTPTGNIPDLPNLDGFYVGKITQVTKREDTQNGTYKVVEFIMPICPKSVGTLTIPPWRWECAVRRIGWGWLDNYPLTKQSESIAIEVRPLPDSPDNFYGAVGNFTLTSSLTQTEVEVGTPVYLLITIQGEGYPELIRAPKKLNVDWAYVSEPEVISTTAESWQSIQKTFRYMITPSKPGNFQIPTFEYAYFNPSLGQYATLKTNSFPLRVKEGAGGKNDIITAGGHPRQETKQVELSNINLLPIITEGVQIKPKEKWRNYIFWGLFIIPPCISLCFLGLGIRREYLFENPSYQRKINAFRKPEQKLNEFKNQGNIATAVELALKSCIGDYFAVDNPRGLTADDICLILQKNNVSEEVITQINKILKTCERIRYSGMQINSDEVKSIEDSYYLAIKQLKRVLRT